MMDESLTHCVVELGGREHVIALFQLERRDDRVRRLRGILDEYPIVGTSAKRRCRSVRRFAEQSRQLLPEEFVTFSCGIHVTD